MRKILLLVSFLFVTSTSLFAQDLFSSLVSGSIAGSIAADEIQSKMQEQKIVNNNYGCLIVLKDLWNREIGIVSSKIEKMYPSECSTLQNQIALCYHIKGEDTSIYTFMTPSQITKIIKETCN